jgi:hypothetical protein
VPIPIEGFVRKLARRSNVFVIGFLDCCRIDVMQKGNANPGKPIEGQYKMLFASKPGSPAVSGMAGTSKATESFLKHFSTIP